MGFLDHSTNNIIIDAVLTDYGRRLLAENQGGFKVSFFSLSDDEVDYSTIRKFGRMVGKEKIMKNTPIFEAQTSSNLAMKHRLLTLPNPLIAVMPSLKMESVVTNGTAGTLGTNSVVFSGQEPVSITFNQALSTDSENAIPVGLSDQTYTILVNDRFFKINATKLSTTSNTKIAAYSLKADSHNAGGIQNATSVKVTIERRSPLDTALYTQFGDPGNTTITSVLSVIGDQSGLRKDIKLQIQQTTSG